MIHSNMALTRAQQQQQQQGGGGFLEEMMKGSSTKALVIKVNIAFLAFFILAYILLFLQPGSLYPGGGGSSAATLLVKKVEDGLMMKVVADDEERVPKDALPAFLDEMVSRSARVALVNMGSTPAASATTDGWRRHGGAAVVDVGFERVSELMEWRDLFPEWIDEEEEGDGPSCPEVPMPDLSGIGDEGVDVVVARVPCRFPEEGWGRDVERLQATLAAAAVTARKGRRDGVGRVSVVVWSGCRPMIEVFRCDDLVRREGDWWEFRVEAERLRRKLQLPVGSCKLALPIWKEGSINDRYDLSALRSPVDPSRREAYATVIHSSDKYVCGAIALAQSLLRTGTDRDLVLLHDKSIPASKLAALHSAGWQLRLIKRIRNPHAERGTYNEYNYSKLRLWLLTSYSKVVFVDSDVVVLRTLDPLFSLPQLSAVGNDAHIFNSGVMVLEPSVCLFKAMMAMRRRVISYNGGDQGFLNEAFPWWHRLPRRVNFLKNFWANTTGERAVKDRLLGADPPELHAIHYLGIKPWMCYRDYDCNWDIGDQRVYASDDAHETWWRVHDGMEEGLRGFCGLTEKRKVELLWDRKLAGKAGFADEHWRINVTDPRRLD